MSLKERVTELLKDFLIENPKLFLVNLTVTSSNKVEIVLDGDDGVSLQDCINASRAVENNIDREDCDFSLDVASAGLSNPLLLTRQYIKNIGRDVKVVLTNGDKLEAKLTDATNDSIELQWTSREPKKIGKGKELVNHNRKVEYSEIKEAIIIVSF